MRGFVVWTILFVGGHCCCLLAEETRLIVLYTMNGMSPGADQP